MEHTAANPQPSGCSDTGEEQEQRCQKRSAVDISQNVLQVLFFFFSLDFKAVVMLQTSFSVCLLVFQCMHTKMLGLFKVATQTRTGLWALL